MEHFGLLLFARYRSEYVIVYLHKRRIDRVSSAKRWEKIGETEEVEEMAKIYYHIISYHQAISRDG